jgi:hypothetical protein
MPKSWHSTGDVQQNSFYASRNDGQRRQAKKLERLKSCVHFYLEREWLARDIAKDFEAPESSPD